MPDENFNEKPNSGNIKARKRPDGLLKGQKKNSVILLFLGR